MVILSMFSIISLWKASCMRISITNAKVRKISHICHYPENIVSLYKKKTLLWQ